jgi:hypothetical protein
MSLPLGGGIPTVLASGQSGATAIALDAGSVYWSTNGSAAGGFADGTVMRVAKP